MGGEFLSRMLTPVERMYEIYEDLKMGYVIFTNADMGDYLHPKMAELLVEGKKKERVVELSKKE